MGVMKYVHDVSPDVRPDAVIKIPAGMLSQAQNQCMHRGGEAFRKFVAGPPSVMLSRAQIEEPWADHAQWEKNPTYDICLHGYIAQWLERLTTDKRVPGSNPGTPFS